MGATAITNRRVVGFVDRMKVVEVTLTMSASYATGGDSLALGSLGLRSVSQMSLASMDSGGSGPGAMTSGKVIPAVSGEVGASLVLAGTSTVPLVKAFDAQSTEFANATNLSARGPFRVRFFGF